MIYVSRVCCKKLKVTTRVKHHMSRRNESLSGWQCEHSTRCLVIAFNERVYREGSSNRQPKVPNGNNKSAKKTQKHQRNIRVCTQAALYDPAFERNLWTLTTCWWDERSWNRRPKVTDATKTRRSLGNPKEISVCERKPRFRMQRRQTFPCLHFYPNLDTF